ncbi:MAG: hypothetical protein ACI3XQ_07005 [Eubacteriales bacterium]
MSKQVLKIISDAMESMGIEYGFGVYNTNPIKYPFFIGEYTESTPMNEDGLQESNFILTGYARGSWLPLENAKEKIESYFNQVSGKTVIAENGSAVAVFYSGASIAPTVDAELRRIQINLEIKEWKVN